MIQQRKKDYLQRLIEEFFDKFNKVINSEKKEDEETKKAILNDAFQFFFDNFEITAEDNTETLLAKIGSIELAEQYARLILLHHQLHKETKTDLYKALEIVNILEQSDKTYSWQRTTLKQDILQILDEA